MSGLNPEIYKKIETPLTHKLCKDQANYFGAIFNNEFAKCNLIEDASFKNKCATELAVLNGDTKICLQTTENYQNICYETFALSRLDLETCNNIKPIAEITKLQAEALKDECFGLLAISRNFGEKPCNMIINPQKREGCLKLFENE